MTQEYSRAEEQAKGRLRGIVNRLAEQGLEVESVIGFGRPAEEIVRAADNNDCDYIAMSTHGRNVVGRGILGSVTDKVVHSAQMPVLTVTPEIPRKYWLEGSTISRIMAPSDGSPLADSAMPYVEHLAREMSLEIVLTRAVDVSRTDAYLANYWEVKSGLETEATEHLRGNAEMLKAKYLEAEWILLKGSPAREIVNLAQEIPQCMIALSTRGRSGLTRWVMGSVTEAVIRASGAPVLVIPPGKAQEKSAEMEA